MKSHHDRSGLMGITRGRPRSFIRATALLLAFPVAFLVGPFLPVPAVDASGWAGRDAVDTIAILPVAEGALLEFAVSATDPDGDTLAYTASNLPPGASFDPGTRTFSWTPSAGQAGTYSIRFEVSDGLLTDSEDVTITVSTPAGRGGGKGKNRRYETPGRDKKKPTEA